ncbi:MAG: ABC transporter substrate-binding protein [bacterium]
MFINSPKDLTAILRLFFLAFLLYFFYSKSILAQEHNHRNNRQLIIGDLVGRTDIRDTKILTKQGHVSIFDNGNQKPFELIKSTPKQLVLQYHLTDGFKFNNPIQIVYKFYETERALISALILDEVDFAILENEASALEVKKSNAHFLPLPRQMAPNTVKMICYNNRKDFLKIRKVRLALSYAIDRAQIIKRLIGGKANAAKGPFDSDSPLFKSGLYSYYYHPKKAIQLLFEAGVVDSDGDGIRDISGKPLRFNLYYQKGVILDEAISRLIKINLLKIGVDINPKPLTKSELNKHLDSKEFDAVLMDYTFENNFQKMENFFSSHGSMNYMGYRNRTFENYVKDYKETMNTKIRKNLLKSMQVVINNDQPVNFLYFKWNTHYMININKFDNYRDKRGNIRPYEEWIIKTKLVK